ncbi:chorion class CA protein ERA.1-like [Melitaea cinxia]|uniref:chorion class CA protein ERA.1-like n=1 Tax=Melitaea cinxia TaxID=113334 RepID=UPI001E274081|nr:chorion class CA protein ERA.1-like [Melitaea cinxia]
MSTFAFLLLCFQACLIQNVYTQCHGSYGPSIGRPISWEGGQISTGCGRGLAGLIDGSLASPQYASLVGPSTAAYGGTGVGDVAVAGEMGVAGTTLVTGQVPILGAVEFGGVVPACGTVSITGSCGCGCHSH